MGRYANVVQTELNGIHLAAKEISSKNIFGKNICIYTDRSVGLECHEALVKVSDNNMVTLKGIKGHGKYKGNHIADALAKKQQKQS